MPSPLPRRKRPRSPLPLTSAPKRAVVALSSILAAATGVSAFAPRHHSASTSRRTPNPGAFSRRRGTHVTAGAKNDGDRGDDGGGRNDGDDDWRAFRARLVRDGLPSLGDDGDAGSDETPPLNSAADDTNTPSAAAGDPARYAHESALVEVGTVLLSIPTTDLCQVVEQQYWHRSVVLITATADDMVDGHAETVPEDQLARGVGRGRWTYRGVRLNRMTDLVVHDMEGGRAVVRSGTGGDDEVEWPILIGGDLAGLDARDGNTQFMCLHSLSDPELREGSTRIVENLYTCSLQHAQNMCTSYPRCGPRNFYTFGGFCSWRPGQLEREMGEGSWEWVAASVDGESVLDELGRVVAAAATPAAEATGTEGGPAEVSPARRLLEAGTDMWRTLLDRIGKTESEATLRIPAGQLRFYDRMLEVWADENLATAVGDVDNKQGSDDSDHSIPIDDSTDLLGPGTLVRSTADVPNNVLLLDQEFIRSVILVLEDTPEATVGLLLSHPLAAAVECVEGAEPIPLRYGGPLNAYDWKTGATADGDDDFDDDGDDVDEGEMYEGFLEGTMTEGEFDFDGVYDEQDYEDYGEDDSPFVWLHRDASLGSRGPDGGGGLPLGTSGAYLINETEAISALQAGTLDHEDCMVFAGVCVWEKAPDLGSAGGGLREQIDVLRALEIVRGCDERGDGTTALDSAWDIFSRRQSVLTKESLDANVDAAVDAWAACTSDEDALAVVRSCSKEALSDAALRAWLGVNLLGDPLGTFVEVKGARGHELRDQ